MISIAFLQSNVDTTWQLLKTAKYRLCFVIEGIQLMQHPDQYMYCKHIPLLLQPIYMSYTSVASTGWGWGIYMDGGAFKKRVKNVKGCWHSKMPQNKPGGDGKQNILTIPSIVSNLSRRGSLKVTWNVLQTVRNKRSSLTNQLGQPCFQRLKDDSMSSNKIPEMVRYFLFVLQPRLLCL